MNHINSNLISTSVLHSFFILPSDINSRYFNKLLMFSNQTSGNLSIYGTREHGMSVRETNVKAVQTISNILKSSLGPHGLDKMLVDDLGDVTISNDGAT